MADFELHPTLAGDTLSVASLGVSELLLMNDARFPWCILVPRVPGLSEWHQIPTQHRLDVQSEIEAVSIALLALSGVTKLNVGALGNRVPQLHIHVVGRHPNDAAWPDPVWGHGTPEPYPQAAAERRLSHLKSQLETTARG